MHLGFGIMILVATLMLSGCKFQTGVGYNQGYSPDQPIPFDHSLHVSQNQIQCLYCHSQATSSTQMTIPALSTCMNCHLVVKTDSPHIQKLREAYDKGESMPWVKVHMLPDHVKFTHSAHLANGVNCQTCHGAVESMQKITQVSDLSMGWCVNCHRESQHNAPINCTTCHH
jgi:hypothetical protein